MEKHNEDSFFAGSQKNDWAQRAEILHKNITALDLHERELENQSAAPPPPTSVSVAAVPPAAASAAPVAMTTAQTQEQDPVVGNWMWQGQHLVALGADQTAAGAKTGTWRCVSTTAAGRSYEFRWKHPGWVDSMVLSEDGKKLDGTNAQGIHVFAERK